MREYLFLLILFYITFTMQIFMYLFQDIIKGSHGTKKFEYGLNSRFSKSPINKNQPLNIFTFSANNVRQGKKAEKFPYSDPTLFLYQVQPPQRFKFISVPYLTPPENTSSTPFNYHPVFKPPSTDLLFSTPTDKPSLSTQISNLNSTKPSKAGNFIRASDKLLDNNQNNFSLPQSSSNENLGNFVVHINTGRNNISVKIDEKLVFKKYLWETKNGTPFVQPGLYLFIIHQTSAELLKAELFSTFQYGADYELMKVLLDLQPGHVVVLLNAFDGFRSLSNIFEKFMKKQGSTQLSEAKKGDRWVMVWRNEGEKLLEELIKCESKASCDFNEPGNLQLSLSIRKIRKKDCVNWQADDKLLEKRRKFCGEQANFSDVCSCSNPLKFDPNSLYQYENLKDSLLIIIASNRPEYLKKTLKQLFKTKGFDASRTLVSIDGQFQLVQDLLDVLNISYSVFESKNTTVSQRIVNHYFYALKRAFAHHPNVNFAIVLEEDLKVAPDFFSYFNQLAPILKKDKSLYCVSAWSETGYEPTASDPSAVQRTDLMPGLGWMLTRKLFEELELKWPLEKTRMDWDMWMRLKKQQKSRQCIIPEISRTYHFGTHGYHTSLYDQELFYTGKLITKDEDVKLKDLDRLDLETYENDLIKAIKLSVQIDSSGHDFCASDFRLSKNESYVLWIKVNNKRDNSTWVAVSTCLGMPTYYMRGGFNFVWAIRFYGVRLYIIGWPISKYRHLKSEKIHVVRTGNENIEPPVEVQAEPEQSNMEK